MDSGANWSEKVEDLVDGGEINEAISLLEKMVSKLEIESQISPSDSQLVKQLSTALLDLSKLYSTKGLSLQADQTRSRAFVIKQQQDSIKENRSESQRFSCPFLSFVAKERGNFAFLEFK